MYFCQFFRAKDLKIGYALIKVYLVDFLWDQNSIVATKCDAMYWPQVKDSPSRTRSFETTMLLDE